MTVVAGYGAATANAAGLVRQTAIVAPSNATYDVSASQAGFGTMGRTALSGNTTVCEEFTCLTGSVVEILNASTDGTYSICLFGDLG